MIRAALASVACLAFAWVPSAGADVVTTKAGLVLEGSVARDKDGSLVVTTAGGEVRLSAADVTSVTPGEGPRAAAERARRELAATDATGHFRLALAFDAQGLPDLAREEYQSVVAVEPDHPAARRALGFEKVGDRWITVAEARRRAGLVLYGGKWLLAAEVDLLARGKKSVAVKDASLVGAMKTAATTPALRAAAQARIALAGPVERVDAARALLVHHDPVVRRFACHELENQGDESALRTLVALCVRDTNPGVRAAAVRAAATFGNDDIAIPLVRALGSSHPTYVANAARSLAMLGDRRAVRYIVKRIVSHGSSPGSYFAHETQTTYIRDFDVEVAQTSFIADPIIGTIGEGEVADVKVLDVSMERTIVETILVDSFNRLAHASAKSADDVTAWMKVNEARLPDFSATPAAARAERSAIPEGTTDDAATPPSSADPAAPAPPDAPARPVAPAQSGAPAAPPAPSTAPASPTGPR